MGNLDLRIAINFCNLKSYLIEISPGKKYFQWQLFVQISQGKIFENVVSGHKDPDV